MLKSNGYQPLVSFLLGAATAVACIVLVMPAVQFASPAALRRNEARVAFDHEDNKTVKFPGLAEVLREAAMDNNTIILTTLNEAWSNPNSILDLFLESLHIGEQTEHLLRHLVIVAMDPKAFERCKEVHTLCYFLTTEGVDFAAEKFYMTQDYLKMMWRRLEFLQAILELRYNFLFTDLDIMWFRNPFLHFPTDADVVFASDIFNGNSADRRNFPNNGFVYVRSSEKTIKFYDYWNLCRKVFPHTDEQKVLNRIKNDTYVSILDVNIQFLDTAYYGGFCQPSKDLNKVCTMHANCCVGMQTKIHELKILLDDWKNYTSRPIEEREKARPTWSVQKFCNF